VNKGNQSDIDQLKAELANAQYGKLRNTAQMKEQGRNKTKIN